MSLLEMSFTGTILILVIGMIRAVAINKLPKRTFLVLWTVALLRLLLPFALPSVFSVYSVLGTDMPRVAFSETETVNVMPITLPNQPNQVHAVQGTQQISAQNTNTVSAWFVIWCIGMVVCLAFFVISYLRCLFEFRFSVPVRNALVKEWLDGHPLKRPMSVRQTDRISTPLTYGIFRPVILMPKKTDWENGEQLQYILSHEYSHIRHFDTVLKLVSAFALCVHWFNPFVWAMYILFNRDIELACDESVLQKYSHTDRATYARMLINMEAKKSRLTPFCNNFSKNAIEERITAIMKIKKSSLSAAILAILLIAGVTTVFATSADHITEKTAPVPDTQFTDAEYEKLLALQLDGYENMSVSEYRNRVWELTDTIEYRTLLERFAQDEELYEMKDSNETASFLFHVLEPLTAENWQTRYFSGYTASDYSWPADNASLEYSLTFTILDDEALTVREYNAARLDMIHGLDGILEDLSPEQLQDQTAMQEIIGTKIESLTRQSENDKLQIDIEYKYMPLMNYDAENTENSMANLKDTEEQEPEETEPRMFPNATREDYDSLLALKTPDYPQMSVTDFNDTLLKWANSDFDRTQRIQEDVSRNDYQVSLTEEERSFVSLTMWLSNEENATMIQSLKSGKPEENPWYSSRFYKQQGDSRLAWCSLYYQFAYHISDKDLITVSERDHAIVGMINAIQEFWDETDLEELLKMDETNIIHIFKEMASRYSNDQIEIIIDEEQISFEGLDERGYF